MYRKIALALVAAGTVSACSITPESYESTPVRVSSPMGPVICQLYTLEQVTWDRSINRPAAMDVKTADNLCRAEGARIINGKQPDYAAVEAASAN